MVKPMSGRLFSFSNNGMRSNNPRTANQKLFAVRHALAARIQEEGFPIESKLTTATDVEDYFSGERIVCLRCGKPYKALTGHLHKIHGWSVEEYKEFYGLPWRRGLTCSETRSKKAEISKRNVEAGLGLGAMSREDADAARKLAHSARHRKPTTANLNRARARIVNVNGGEVYQEDEFDAVLNLMVAEDKTAKEALLVLQKPSMSTFYERTRTDKAFGKRYRHLVENSLSYAAQLRCQMLGKRFANECMRQRAAGVLVEDIAQQHGVSYQTVINKTLGFKKPLSTHCAKGHLKVNGRCKACDTETARRRRGHMPREESAKALVPSTCDDCSTDIMVVRLRGLNRPKYCKECRKNRHLEYHRNYRKRPIDEPLKSD